MVARCSIAVLLEYAKSNVQGFVFPPDTGLELFSDTEDNVFLMEMVRLCYTLKS